ncbi:unnamed protein product [Brassica rapa]|uniref:Peptidase C1A papain C-terminal domain-containing protein n=2 Tax=Brassica campestris TaxID=3711 RepID=A0A8D9HKV9_BRACM|nr:unnamed protein product [Brassica rapa]
MQVMETGCFIQYNKEGTKGSSGNKGDTIRIEDYTFVGGDFKAALNILQMQPIGALLHVFQEYWDIKKGDIYRGPTSNNTKYCGFHAVFIVDAFMINEDFIFWCDSSSSKHIHDGVYIMVSFNYENERI